MRECDFHVPAPSPDGLRLCGPPRLNRWTAILSASWIATADVMAYERGEGQGDPMPCEETAIKKEDSPTSFDSPKDALGFYVPHCQFLCKLFRQSIPTPQHPTRKRSWNMTAGKGSRAGMAGACLAPHLPVSIIECSLVERDNSFLRSSTEWSDDDLERGENFEKSDPKYRPSAAVCVRDPMRAAAQLPKPCHPADAPSNCAHLMV